MKNIKRILALALIVLMTLSLAACGASDEKKLIGKWNFDLNSLYSMMGISAEDAGAYESLLEGVSATMEFTKDDKAIMVMTIMSETTTEEGAYTIEDGKIIIDGDPAAYKIEKDTLTITDSETGISMTLKKAK